jgi:hypothetical protein
MTTAAAALNTPLAARCEARVLRSAVVCSESLAGLHAACQASAPFPNLFACPCRLNYMLQAAFCAYPNPSNWPALMQAQRMNESNGPLSAAALYTGEAPASLGLPACACLQQPAWLPRASGACAAGRV